MKEYNDTIKYVETTEPDKIAEYIKDLEQQLADKDKEIEKLKQIINTLHQNTRSASIEDSNLIHELENQIAEKDKEITNIRHQVCDEIRETIKYFQHQVPVWLIMERLDQVEGENDDK